MRVFPTPRPGALVLAALLSTAFVVPALADCGFNRGDPNAGEKVYSETCVACHGEDGHGAVPGAPDFAKKGGALSRPHKLLSQHIEKGFQEPGKPLAMPPKGGNPGLTTKDIENVHAFLHRHFGCGK